MGEIKIFALVVWYYREESRASIMSNIEEESALLSHEL